MASGHKNPFEDEEIAGFLTQIFNLEVSKKDIIDCKPEFVQKFYTLFMKDFGASIEKINHVPIGAPASISQYPDMYKSTIFLLGLAKLVNYYLSLIHKNSIDFMIKDIIQPNYNRTKIFFTIFLEFYDFLYQKIDKYEAVENQADMEKIKFDKLQERIKDLKIEIEQRQIKNAENEICFKKEMEQFTEAQKEFEKVQSTKNKVKEEIETIKNEIKTIFSKIKKTELKILEGKEQILVLKTLVIQDDEMSKCKENEALLTSLKNSNAELKNQRQDLNNNLLTIKEKEKFITSSLLSILEEIEMENAKNKEAEVMGNEFKKISLALTDKFEDLSRTRQELIEYMNMLQEKKDSLQNANEVKKKGLLEEIKQLRLNALELQNSNEKQNLAEKECAGEIEKYKEDFKNKNLKLKEFLSVVDESIATMMKKVREIDMKRNTEI